MDYREEIKKSKIKRIWFAMKMGMRYSTFSGKLAGFGPWLKGEEERLQKIIKEAKGKK